MPARSVRSTAGSPQSPKSWMDKDSKDGGSRPSLGARPSLTHVPSDYEIRRGQSWSEMETLYRIQPHTAEEGGHPQVAGRSDALGGLEWDHRNSTEALGAHACVLPTATRPIASPSSSSSSSAAKQPARPVSAAVPALPGARHSSHDFRRAASLIQPTTVDDTDADYIVPDPDATLDSDDDDDRADVDDITIDVGGGSSGGSNKRKHLTRRASEI